VPDELDEFRPEKVVTKSSAAGDPLAGDSPAWQNANMIKTQIQIPDHLYREAKRISEQYEMSFAEVVRRALERLLPAYPSRTGPAVAWQLPTLDLGLKMDPFADPEWRANLYVDINEVREPTSPAPRKRTRKRVR
jgi:hypothetical protein